MKCIRFRLKTKGTVEISRFSVMQVAYKFGVRGFVKRNANKTVLIEAEGDEEQVSDFLKSFETRSVTIWAEPEVVLESELKNYTQFDVV